MKTLLHDLCSAFATAEGWFHPDPKVAPRRLNNPGDLVFAGQIGAKPSKVRVGGLGSKLFLAEFDTPAHGIAALYRQILKRIAEGQTLRQLIAQYAPPNENDTENYVRETARRVGVDPDKPLIDFLTLERKE